MAFRKISSEEKVEDIWGNQLGLGIKKKKCRGFLTIFTGSPFWQDIGTPEILYSWGDFCLSVWLIPEFIEVCVPLRDCCIDVVSFFSFENWTIGLSRPYRWGDFLVQSNGAPDFDQQGTIFAKPTPSHKEGETIRPNDIRQKQSRDSSHDW